MIMAAPPVGRNYRRARPSSQVRVSGFQHVCESERECARASVRDEAAEGSLAARACLWLTS